MRITAGVLFPHLSTSRPLDFSANALRTRPLAEAGRVPAHPVAEPATRRGAAADRAEADALEPALADLVRLHASSACARSGAARRPARTAHSAAPATTGATASQGSSIAQPRLAQPVDGDQLIAVDASRRCRHPGRRAARQLPRRRLCRSQRRTIGEDAPPPPRSQLRRRAAPRPASPTHDVADSRPSTPPYSDSRSPANGFGSV